MNPNDPIEKQIADWLSISDELVMVVPPGEHQLEETIEEAESLKDVLIRMGFVEVGNGVYEWDGED